MRDLDNQRRRIFSTYPMNGSQRARMERAYDNVANRMTAFTRSKGLMDGGSMKYYDRKVSAEVRQGSKGLVAG